MVKARYRVLSIAVFLMVAVFGARLFSVQVLQHDDYVDTANSVRVKKYELLAKRGEIFMKSGEDEVVPLVLNERTWTIFVDPSYVINRDKVQSRLTEILGDQLIVDWDKNVWSDLTNMYVEVAKNVDYNTVSAIKKEGLQGVGHKETSRRVYPRNELAAQVVGFINAEGVGTGIEGAQNKRLAGKNGSLKTVTDVNDIPLSLGDENVKVPAEDGESLVLTLDENVQRESEKALKDIYDEYKGAIRHASIVVMNPQNGQIYSMANYPTFNPEEYYKVMDASLFTNTPTDSPYEPASICKTFTYATAVDQGKIRPDDTYVNTGHTQVEDIVIQNAGGSMRQLGEITYQTALNYSLNTGSVDVLRKIGNNSIDEQARWTLYNYLTDNFSLGKATGLGLYEAPGTIISPAEQEGNAVRYSNMSFGQGMNLTMVQVLAGFSSIVNGGEYYKPTILAGKMVNGEFVANDPNDVDHRAVSTETSTTMRQMLATVREQSWNGGDDDPDGYIIGSKTGTGETLNDDGTYTSEKTVVGVAGFGMSSREGAMPEYTILVRVDGETLLWGSEAIKVFTRLSNYMIEYLRIQPGA